MTFLEILLVAVCLAMDAFAVSVASGVALKRCCVSNAFKIAFAFGLFQALMPVVGWLAGLSLQPYIQKVSHWVAFGLLTFIGIKMIAESTRLDDSERRTNPLEFGTLLMLSVATSVDALAVGISLGILHMNVWMPILVIGCVTLIICFVGVYLGDRIGRFFGKQIERIGGLVLIGIGVKILVAHLV